MTSGFLAIISHPIAEQAQMPGRIDKLHPGGAKVILGRKTRSWAAYQAFAAKICYPRMQKFISA
ncbi:MAG TPA: hypothetical protein VN455_13115, partial [Methanotrichaceae archaeon]|nr:hypothetical protein [Methanotrichaceae archaeon]